ncbi:MAG: uroporphyrinogen decarboxylase family protein [Planctomycetota bacterium]|jgi:uroporphyrinogen-III decarboxylase
MNSRQRIAASMEHKKPDRIPVMCQLALGHYFLSGSYKPSEIWFNSETFAKALVELQQEYEFDGILVNIPGRPANWKDSLKSYKRIENNEHLYWKSGLETVFPPDDNPLTYQPKQLPLKRANYRSVDIDDPATYRLSGYVWNTWHAPELWGIDPQAELSDPTAYPDWFTSTLKKVQQFAPDVSIHVEVFSPFTHLMELFGYEQALLALVDDPRKCHEVLAVFARNVLIQIELYAGCRPDAILVSSAFAGAGFISRQMYKEFVVPYEDQIFRAIHRHGSKSYVHTCGAIGDRLDLMSETSVDGIDTLDPPPLGTVYLEDAKSKYGRRFFFKGNLDAVNEMLNADDQAFEQAVKERIKIGKPGGGYILSSACSVAPHVKPERLKRLTALATQHGKY